MRFQNKPKPPVDATIEPRSIDYPANALEEQTYRSHCRRRGTHLLTPMDVLNIQTARFKRAKPKYDLT